MTPLMQTVAPPWPQSAVGDVPEESPGHALVFHGSGGTLFGIHVVNVLLTLLTLGMFAPGIAQAHVKVINTRLSMQVSDAKISKGQRVTFSGALKSKNRRCFRGKTVSITRRGRVIASDTTNRRGRYSVSKKIRKAGPYRAVFTGFTFGTHPHNHTCSSSSSSITRIRIQR